MSIQHEKFIERLKHAPIQLENISGESYQSIYYTFENFVYVIKLEKIETQGFMVAYITFFWHRETLGKPSFTYYEVNTDNFKKSVMNSLEHNPTVRLHLLF